MAAGSGGIDIKCNVKKTADGGS